METWGLEEELVGGVVATVVLGGEAGPWVVGVVGTVVGDDARDVGRLDGAEADEPDGAPKKDEPELELVELVELDEDELNELDELDELEELDKLEKPAPATVGAAPNPLSVGVPVGLPAVGVTASGVELGGEA